VCRITYAALVKEDFALGQNVGIVAGSEMLKKLQEFNVASSSDSRHYFFVRPSGEFVSEHYIGDFENIIQLSTKHQFDSVLISVHDFELTEAITNVNILKEHGLHATIIDQHDIHNVLAENVKHKNLLDSKAMDFKILFWENRITKRCFDIIFAILLLPISIFHKRLKFSDMIKIICNEKSLVGYRKEDSLLNKLPNLKTGVIPVSRRRRLLKDIHVENLDYALHYSIFSDFKNLVYFLV